MKISIIIVNYNTFDYTQQCIDSVLEALKFSNINGEIIVIDNDSPDKSGEKLKKFYKDNSQVDIILNNDNEGFAKANNIGLEKAQGDYILLLNSDTVIQSDTLQKCLDYLDKHEDYDVLGCKVVLGDGKLDPACKRSFPTPLNSLFHTLKLDSIFKKSPTIGSYNLTYIDEDTTTEVDCITGAFILLRRDVYEKVGGLDEEYFMYGEDIDWCYRIKEAGFRIIYHPVSEITHFKKASWDGKANPKVLDAFYDSMLIFYDKHYQEKYPKLVNLLVKSGTKSLKSLARLKNNVKKEN